MPHHSGVSFSDPSTHRMKRTTVPPREHSTSTRSSLPDPSPDSRSRPGVELGLVKGVRGPSSGLDRSINTPRRLLESLEQASEKVLDKSLSLLSVMGPQISAQMKLQRCRTQVQDPTPKEALMEGIKADALTLKKTVHQVQQQVQARGATPVSPTLAAQRRADLSYCQAVLQMKNATLASIHLPLTCKALVDLSPLQLDQARHEVLWLAGHLKNPGYCADMLCYLLKMDCSLPFRLHTASIPPGQAGKRMMHVLRMAYAQIDSHRTPFSIEGTLPPGIRPEDLPEATNPAQVPVRPKGHAPEMAHSVTLATALAQRIKKFQSTWLKPAEKLIGVELKERMRTAELQGFARQLQYALSRARTLKSARNSDEEHAPRLVHGEAALLTQGLQRYPDIHLPHTHRALCQHPPSPKELVAARREVLCLLMRQPHESGLAVLLNNLLQIDPRTPMTLCPSSLPEDELCINDALDALLPAWPMHNAPRLCLDATLGARHDDDPETARLDMAAVFLQPGMRRLTVSGFYMDNDLMARAVAGVRAHGSDLEELTWQYGPAPSPGSHDLAELVQALPSLHTFSLGFASDSSHHSLSSGLSQVLVTRPLRSLSIRIPGENVGAHLRQLLDPLMQAMVEQEGGVPWQSVSLQAGRVHEDPASPLQDWLLMLAASPEVTCIGLDLPMHHSSATLLQPPPDTSPLRAALRQRSTPLMLELPTDRYLDILRELFVEPPPAQASGSIVPAGSRLAPCLQHLTLRHEHHAFRMIDDLFIRELQSQLPLMSGLRELSLDLEGPDDHLNPTARGFTPSVLQSFIAHWGSLPRPQLNVLGQSRASDELREATVQTWRAMVVQMSNRHGMRFILTSRPGAWMPDDLIDKIEQLTGQPARTATGWRSVPIVNRTHLLSTVDQYDAMVQSQRQHPLAETAQWVMTHQRRENQRV